MSGRTVVGLLEAELEAVRGELVRVDAKCGTLAGLAGVALAVLVTQAGAAQPWPVDVLLAAAGLALTAAAGLLIRVLRPRLGRTGFCKYAATTSRDICRGLAIADLDSSRHHADELIVLSRIALAKYKSLRRAVDLLTAGLALACAALVAGVIA